MLNLEILGSLASDLHRDFRNLFYVLLPLFFAASLALTWLKSPVGGPDFVDCVKRLVIASLLLAGFREITDSILLVTTGITERISNMDGLESYMKMIGEKASTFSLSPMGVVLAMDDFIMAVLSYGSYLIVYLARTLMLSIYHFTWIFLIILSPFLLLFHLFTSKITVNLFRTLVEVACWPIVWAVLSVMLKSLPYGSFMAADSGYTTLIILNFVIAIALVLTPFLIKAIVGGSFSAVASSMLPLTATVIRMTPVTIARVTTRQSVTRSTYRPAMASQPALNRSRSPVPVSRQVSKGPADQERPAEKQTKRSTKPRKEKP